MVPFLFSFGGLIGFGLMLMVWCYAAYLCFAVVSQIWQRNTIPRVLVAGILLHVAEPVVNIPLAWVMLTTSQSRLSSVPPFSLLAAFGLSAPVLVLLLPLIGCFAHDHSLTVRSRTLVWRGGVRWLCCFGTFACVALNVPLLDLAFFFTGYWFLWHSLRQSMLLFDYRVVPQPEVE